MPNDFNPNFVFIDEYGLLGANYYWRKRDDYNLTEEELKQAGLVDERVKVHQDIIKPLQEVDAELQSHGFRLYISEGYRPEALYKLVYEKRSKQFGKKMTDRLVNIIDRPHATGKTVDVTLWDIKTNEPMVLRDRKDGAEALFLDFYKNRPDEQSQYYQKLQDFLISAMLEHGFRLGPKKEYFHFNFEPNVPKNYT